MKLAHGSAQELRLHAVVGRQMLSAVNGNDAIASIKAWFDLLGKESGLLIHSKVDVCESMETMRQRVEGGSVDLLILDIVDFLQLERLKLVRAAMAGDAADGNGPFYSYLLLTGIASQGAVAQGLTIADLRGKRVNTFSRTGGNAARAWIDVMLGRQGLGRASTFFAALQDTPKAQSCVLPLFFGSVDACVVDELSFNLMREMNPQLSRLQVVAKSKPILDALIASPTQARPFKQELEEMLLSLDKSARGKQLLTVFGTNKLRRFKANELDAVRELWREYGALQSKQERN